MQNIWHGKEKKGEKGGKMNYKHTKITSITFTLDEENQGYTVRYKFANNYKNIRVSEDNLRLAARMLTKEAMKLWARMDAEYQRLVEEKEAKK